MLIGAFIVSAVAVSLAPSNLAPSNLAPSNLAPSNLAPSNLAPSNLAPSNLAPSNLAPSNLAPSNLAPSNLAPSNLAAAASASGRPAECSVLGRRAERTTFWRRARLPALTRYCHHIARGQAMLERNAAAAQTAADEAAALFPDKAAPHVLRARAALRLGDESLALAEFERGLAANPHSVDAPAAMHDLAQSQLHTAKLRAALSTYRLLAPRSGLLGSRVKRATVLLEAAHVTMAVMALPSTDTTSDESAPQAPATDESNPGAATARGRMGASLDEALAYLLQAARDPHHARRTDVELSLALVLDRSGKLARADALLAEIRGTRAWIAATERRSPAPDDSVQQALLALALERTDPTRAAVQWEKYVAALASGRWSEAAEKRLARLKARRR